MLRKTLLILSAISLSSAINGCATAPPAVPVCVEIHPAKAHCVNTMTSDEFVIDDVKKFEGKTYWEIRPTMLLVPASSWTKIKTFIITTCKQTGTCGEAVASWDRTIETVDKTMENK